jgi:hypothetical protein
MRLAAAAVLGSLVVAGCAAPSPHLSPRAAAYKELHKGMAKREVAAVLRAARRVRVVQMGDPSDPAEDLEFWNYSPDPDNDYVVFTSEGKLLQWEYHDPAEARAGGQPRIGL